MSIAFIVLCLSFVSMLLLGVPIVSVIAISSTIAIMATGREPLEISSTSMAHGVDSFALLAIPFFILSGRIMGHGTMAQRLIDLASALVIRFPGGLAYVNTIACTLFGSISGSSAAAVSSIGAFMIPQMKEKGYDKDFATALTICSSTTGMLIPPSNTMIVYSVAVGGLSVGAIFIAGIIPGLLLAFALMVTSSFYILKKNIKGEGCFNINLIWMTFKRAFLSLFLIVIVIGGILGGIFTATESAAISVLYAFVLEVFVYRDISIKELPKIFADSAQTTGIVMLIVGASCAMSWVLTMTNAPQEIVQAIMGISDNKVILLLVINLILLLVGTFMDMTPAILIFTPIFLPIVRELGITDLHFGIIMIANLSIGLCTPPVGTCLFLGCGVGKTDIGAVAPKLIPYVIAMIIVVLFITFIPALSLWLPSIMK